MSVSAAAVEAAAKAFYEAAHGLPWASASTSQQAELVRCARVALNAAMPHIKKAGK